MSFCPFIWRADGAIPGDAEAAPGVEGARSRVETGTAGGICWNFAYIDTLTWAVSCSLLRQVLLKVCVQE